MSWNVHIRHLNRCRHLPSARRKGRPAACRQSLPSARSSNSSTSAKQVEVGEELIDQIDEKMWGDLDLTRDAMTQCVRAEASRITAPHLATYWGWPTSRGSHTPDHWLVELPAVYVQDERAQSWEQYRFHVAGKQIKGWTASPSHTAGTYI